jgi:hypothetical protein
MPLMHSIVLEDRLLNTIMTEVRARVMAIVVF